MGLDISAYSKLTYLDPQPVTDEELERQNETNPIVGLYNANGFDRLLQPEGYYTHGHDCDYQYIACGAYSRYGRWRDDLARLSGWPLTHYERYGKMWPSYAESAFKCESGPFWELIRFGDNDGSIGPVVSAKLAQDFAEHRPAIAERANAYHRAVAEWDGDYFMRKYDEWCAAFVLAAQGGAVKFH